MGPAILNENCYVQIDHVSENVATIIKVSNIFLVKIDCLKALALAYLHEILLTPFSFI